jgi:hypothetical protein
MKTLHILIVTRNRVSGLIDALSSVKRLNLLLRNLINIEVTIQDNSDIPAPGSIISYFGKFFFLRYFKTSYILPMSMNWHEGLQRVVDQSPDYISVLADRRLVSANLINAAKHLEDKKQLFICFDHQDVWINSEQILVRNHTHGLQAYCQVDLLKAIGSAQINWHYPMLFNCLLTTEFMIRLFDRYGSFAEGSSPDMNFLARVADLGIDSYYTYDAPCIVTNARHAATSNGSSALKIGTIYDNEHTRLSGTEAYPTYMENFISANITGSLARYWSDSQMRALIDPDKFYNSALIELSYPKSEKAFLAMKNSLDHFANDYCLDSEVRSLVDHVQHSPACNQRYPIDSNPGLQNAPTFGLLGQVENITV